jgi:hypothetical protein
MAAVGRFECQLDEYVKIDYASAGVLPAHLWWYAATFTAAAALLPGAPVGEDNCRAGVNGEQHHAAFRWLTPLLYRCAVVKDDLEGLLPCALQFMPGRPSRSIPDTWRRLTAVYRRMGGGRRCALPTGCMARRSVLFVAATEKNCAGYGLRTWIVLPPAPRANGRLLCWRR